MRPRGAITSQGTPHGRFQQAIHARHVRNAEMAARREAAKGAAVLRDSCDRSGSNGLCSAALPVLVAAVAPAASRSGDQPGTPHGRFQRAIHARHVQNAEMAAREMGGLSLADALLLCELLAKTDVKRYERAALRWLQRFIDERLPPLTEVALAASALAELRHGTRNTGIDTLKRLLRHG
jgi:hypothetical protein